MTTDILERLRNYSPPDRTVDDLRQASMDIHEAANEIERLRSLAWKYAAELQGLKFEAAVNGTAQRE
jgi:hypothetical protein